MKFLYTVVLFFEKKKRRFLEREGEGVYLSFERDVVVVCVSAMDWRGLDPSCACLFYSRTVRVWSEWRMDLWRSIMIIPPPLPVCSRPFSFWIDPSKLHTALLLCLSSLPTISPWKEGDSFKGNRFLFSFTILPIPTHRRMRFLNIFSYWISWICGHWSSFKKSSFWMPMCWCYIISMNSLNVLLCVAWTPPH